MSLRLSHERAAMFRQYGLSLSFSIVPASFDAAAPPPGRPGSGQAAAEGILLLHKFFHLFQEIGITARGNNIL